ncbi:DivIVA domain-containing protein [Spiroplasma endosymbiont of Aspidapion aeneum]|uniref:DivIVA domain-containing protein n=1 Tax=Spiroplasma endosymbiont of Aspidapion aeneum TaxID=3066276 RepID=UPI00313A8DAA
MARKLDLRLSAKDIQEYEFQVTLKGFKPEDVDELLDRIVEDYSTFAKVSEKYEKEIRELKESEAKLRAKVADLETMNLKLSDQVLQFQIKISNNASIIKTLNNNKNGELDHLIEKAK